MENDIKRFLDSGAGVALKGYLLSKLDELKDIDNIKEINTPSHQAIELKAQKRAYSKLAEIYSNIMTMGEAPVQKDERDNYNCE